MAIKLREGMTFTPAVQGQYGVVLGINDWYGVIDGLEYHKREKHAAFSVEIYSSKAAREAKAAPVDMVNIFFNKENFDTEIGNDGLTIPRAYELVLQKMTDWESDEI